MTVAAVIGLGTMGPGIAATLARGGMTVRMHDTSAAALEKAPASVAMAFGVLERLGVPAKGTAAAVSGHAKLEEALAGAELVIESVPEKAEIKAAVFRQIDAIVAKDCILASNTSGIPISRLQEGNSAPQRVVGMHWSNPPHVIPMIEVIAGAKTAPATVEWMVRLIRSINLLPVVVRKDVPGFVENRILYAIMREALDLVEKGVIEPAELDACVSWGIGYKLAVIGPMALLDVAGLDIYQAVGSYLNKDLCNRADVSALVEGRMAAGRLGMKAGRGMFEYTPEQLAALPGQRAKRLIAVRRALESDA